MAGVVLHRPPHVQLRELAERARADGKSFGRFWSEAWHEGGRTVMTNDPEAPETAVRWPTDRNDRVAWQAAIRGSRAGWERAYEGLPGPPHEEALFVLGDVLGVLAGASLERRALPARGAIPCAA